MSAVDRLIARAFHRAEAAQANEAIDAMRARQEDETGAAAFSFELFEPQTNADEVLSHQALPKLVYFLHCRGFRDARTPGVFVSLFTRSGLHFIRAGDVLEVLGDVRRLPVAELYRRYGEGGTGDPRLLGP